MGETRCIQHWHCDLRTWVSLTTLCMVCVHIQMYSIFYFYFFEVLDYLTYTTKATWLLWAERGREGKDNGAYLWVFSSLCSLARTTAYTDHSWNRPLGQRNTDQILGPHKLDIRWQSIYLHTRLEGRLYMGQKSEKTTKWKSAAYYYSREHSPWWRQELHKTGSTPVENTVTGRDRS